LRGEPERQMAMLTTLSTEDLIPADHPIRKIRKVVDEVLAALDAEFEAMHSRIGRPSVPPEKLLKATILTALYSIRSERAFCERLNYDLLFKWFLDMPIDAPAFDPTTFTKNRERLLEAEIADRFSRRGSPPGQAAPLHLLRALLRGRDAAGGLASHNSFKPKQGPPPPAISGGRNGEVEFRGLPRTNRTHRSTTDPEALLARKSNAVGSAGSYTVPFARAFPQVTALRRRREHCKNANAAGQVVWVDTRSWGRVDRCLLAAHSPLDGRIQPWRYQTFRVRRPLRCRLL
jgi:transposase